LVVAARTGRSCGQYAGWPTLLRAAPPVTARPPVQSPATRCVTSPSVCLHSGPGVGSWDAASTVVSPGRCRRSATPVVDVRHAPTRTRRHAARGSTLVSSEVSQIGDTCRSMCDTTRRMHPPPPMPRGVDRVVAGRCRRSRHLSSMCQHDPTSTHRRPPPTSLQHGSAPGGARGGRTSSLRPRESSCGPQLRRRHRVVDLVGTRRRLGSRG
jgi:hypothetical protein